MGKSGEREGFLPGLSCGASGEAEKGLEAGGGRTSTAERVFTVRMGSSERGWRWG